MGPKLLDITPTGGSPMFGYGQMPQAWAGCEQEKERETAIEVEREPWLGQRYACSR